jgi:integrase
MTGEIRDLLKKHIEWMSHFEYKHPDGVKKAILFGFDRYMNESSVKYRQMVACAKSGIKLIKIHEFRHSHVSVLINTRQFTSFEIGKRMGHSAKMVEEVYGHLFKESQELMVKTLDQIALEAHAIEEKEEERNPISAVIN